MVSVPLDGGARDPFVHVDVASQNYFLYTIDHGRGQVEVRVSTDLLTWGPASVAFGGGDGPAGRLLSSPRVHRTGNRYLMALTVADPDGVLEAGSTGIRSRRYLTTRPETVVLLSADDPRGPFVPFASPLDPALMTRDGTLHVDAGGAVFLVYAHDWRQKVDGTIEAVQLDPDDLARTLGEPFALFRGSEAAFWREPNFGHLDPAFNAANTHQLGPYVTAAPQVVVSPAGALVLLWTTAREGLRAQLQAVSPTGELRGPWLQQSQLLPRDQASATAFTALDGRRLLIAEAGAPAGPILELHAVEFGDGGALQVPGQAFATRPPTVLGDRTPTPPEPARSASHEAPSAPPSDLLATDFPLTMPELPVHDPFVVADPASGRYFLYTSNRALTRDPSGLGVNGIIAFQSRDLVHWSAPSLVYRVPTTGWNADAAPWAPEVHAWQGRYYLFTTLHNNEVVTLPEQPGDDSTRWVSSTRRATVIAVADTALGPFIDLSPDAPPTPPDFMTLDGTLYVDPAGQPYLVYAHEWLQKQDGTMEALPLTPDLTAAAGAPFLLWRASEASFYTAPRTAARYTTTTDDKLLSPGQLTGYVTDGAFLLTTPNGSLVSLWTSYWDDRYVLLQAISRTGDLRGPWEQLPPLDHSDKGHAMVFRSFAGELLLIEHNHMSVGLPRGEIFEVALTDEGFVLLRHRGDLDGVAD